MLLGIQAQVEAAIKLLTTEEPEPEPQPVAYGERPENCNHPPAMLTIIETMGGPAVTMCGACGESVA